MVYLNKLLPIQMDRTNTLGEGNGSPPPLCIPTRKKIIYAGFLQNTSRFFKKYTLFIFFKRQKSSWFSEDCKESVFNKLKLPETDKS